MMSYVSDENLPSGHSGGDETFTAHTICSRCYLPKLEPEYHHHTTVVSFDHKTVRPLLCEISTTPILLSFVFFSSSR